MPTPQRANTPSSAARKDARATSATRAKPKKSKANDSFISNLANRLNATRRPSGGKSRQTKSRSGKSQSASGGASDGQALQAVMMLHLLQLQIEELEKFLPPLKHKIFELTVRHRIIGRIIDLCGMDVEIKAIVLSTVCDAIDKAYEDAEPLTSEPSPAEPAAPLEQAKPEQTQTVQIDEPSGADDVAEFSDGGADDKTSTEDAQ